MIKINTQQYTQEYTAEEIFQLGKKIVEFLPDNIDKFFKLDTIDQSIFQTLSTFDIKTLDILFNAERESVKYFIRYDNQNNPIILQEKQLKTKYTQQIATIIISKIDFDKLIRIRLLLTPDNPETDNEYQISVRAILNISSTTIIKGIGQLIILAKFL